MDNIQNANTIPTTNYKTVIGKLDKKSVIWLQTPYNPVMIQWLKSCCKATWYPAYKAWYIRDTASHRSLLHLPQKTISEAIQKKIHPINQPALQQLYEHLILKAYAPNTIKTYCQEFAQLLYLLQSTPVNTLNPEKLQAYFLHCHQTLKLSENIIHSRINAVKYYFEQVLLKDTLFIQIPRPKKPLSLPKSLNKNEIKKLFQVTTNPKHALILKLCYGMGLRVSEIVNLQICHIDGVDHRVLIACSKGKKDRYVHLPRSILDEMRTYYLAYKPVKYLFEGIQGGQYAVRSVQQIFKSAMKKAGIYKQIGVHGLRHSYATHLLEYGTDISHIQQLLGHKDIRTTQIYTRVTSYELTNIASPLDRLI